MVRAHLNGFVGPNSFALVHADCLVAVVAHRQSLIMTDGLILVVLDGDGPILLTV